MLTLKVRDDLCLDYANTLCWRGTEKPAEELYGLTDVIRWIERSAIIGGDSLIGNGSLAQAKLEQEQALFSETIAMRETIFRIFSAFATGDEVAAEDFATLKHALAEAPARDALMDAGGVYAWRIEGAPLSMPQLLAPVLWSAGDLMVNAGRRRIRRCANEKCLWMFIDESKSGTRRWCQMSACGNRAKAQRHYSKMKQASR
jgi:predicted RNA-binding Zn ribbon-like protein